MVSDDSGRDFAIAGISNLAQDLSSMPFTLLIGAGGVIRDAIGYVAKHNERKVCAIPSGDFPTQANGGLE